MAQLQHGLALTQSTARLHALSSRVTVRCSQFLLCHRTQPPQAAGLAACPQRQLTATWDSQKRRVLDSASFVPLGCALSLFQLPEPPHPAGGLQQPQPSDRAQQRLCLGRLCAAAGSSGPGRLWLPGHPSQRCTLLAGRQPGLGSAHTVPRRWRKNRPHQLAETCSPCSLRGCPAGPLAARRESCTFRVQGCGLRPRVALGRRAAGGQPRSAQ